MNNNCIEGVSVYVRTIKERERKVNSGHIARTKNNNNKTEKEQKKSSESIRFVFLFVTM